MTTQDSRESSSARYPWRSAKLCESRGPTGEFCEHDAGHDGGHFARKGPGAAVWARNHPYWNGHHWVREYDATPEAA